MIPYLLPCLYLLVPLVACAVAIHWFERITQRRLSTRFGWSSVLWTGWLGTPIHETSHLLMCPVFRHRVDEVAFFEPDRKSGRLGYVRHSFREGNWFEEMGNLFIGTAPLMGGSIVLLALLYVFYPDAATAAWEASANSVSSSSQGLPHETEMEAGTSVWQRMWDQTGSMATQLLTDANWTKPRWWIFLYLVLCVGSHMAPSQSDYRGSLKGSLIAVAVSLALLALLSLFQVDAKSFSEAVSAVGAPLLTVLALATVLCGLATLVVVILTSVLPVRPASLH